MFYFVSCINFVFLYFLYPQGDKEKERKTENETGREKESGREKERGRKRERAREQGGKISLTTHIYFDVYSCTDVNDLVIFQ